MKNSRFAFLFLATAAFVGCGGESAQQGTGTSGSGGSNGSGGSGGNAGNHAGSGGSNASGGSSGASGTGGDNGGSGGATGGSSATGGGATGGGATGGASGTGGSAGAGQAGSAGGGGSGTGGSGGGGTGGAGGTGGSTGSPDASAPRDSGTVVREAGPVPKDIWVSPDGSDANPGTEASPMLTVCDTTLKVGACYKLCPSSYSCPATGATIWMKAGTYKITKKIDIGATRPGVKGGVMNLFAVEGAKVIIDATGLDKSDITKTGVALHIKGSYWHVKGLEIKGAPHNCVKVEGGYNTIETTVVHECGNTGITIGQYAGEDMSDGPGSNNTILNCDSYANVGPNNQGEDADGFGAKKQAGKGNVFKGCRSWYNADDGFDFFGWGDPITVQDCWAFDNAKMGAAGGDGNGFKLGKGPGNHTLSNTISANNVKCGYTSNGADKQSTCTSNCKGCSNGQGLNDSGDRAVLGSVTNMSPCVDVMKAEGARKADGSLPSL